MLQLAGGQGAAEQGNEPKGTHVGRGRQVVGGKLRYHPSNSCLVPAEAQHKKEELSP